MKKIKNIFRITAVVAMMAFAVIWGIMYSPDAKATPQINITYDVYTKANYDVRASFSTDYGYDYATAKLETEVYEAIQNNPATVVAWDTGDGWTYADYNFTDPDAWWDGSYYDTDNTPDDNLYFYATLGNIDKAYSKGSGPNKKNYTVVGKKKTYAQVKAAVNVYEAAAPQTTFAPGDTIVIVPKIQGDHVGSVGLYFDMLFPNSDNTSCLFNVNTDFATLKSRGEMFSFENDQWAASSSSTLSFEVNSTNVDHQFILTGGDFAAYNTNQETGSTSDEVYAYNIELKISGDANGTYPINIGKSSNNTWVNVTGNGTFDTYYYPTTFNSTPTNIIVKGASNKAEASSISVGSGTATKQSNGIEIGSTTYDYWKAPSQTVSTSSVNILPTALDSGTILDVVYSTNKNTVLSGTSVTKTGGTYPIPLGGAGETTYVGIQIKSQDNSQTKWTILEIPKDSYTQAYLTGFTIDSTSTTSSNVNAVLSPNFVANSTTQIAYTISVPQDAQNITFTPQWDTSTYKMTAKYGATAITNGQPITTSDATSNIVIEVKAQDGTHTTTYTFTFQQLSNDNSLSLTVTGYPGLTFDSTDTCTINNVPFKTSSLTYTASNSHNATITVTGSSTDINGNSQPLTLLTDGNNAKQTPLDIVVKAQSGVSKTYHLLVNRKAANTNNAYGSVAVYANDGTSIPGTWTNNNKTFTATNDVDITKTGFYIVATSHANAEGLSELKFGESGSEVAYTSGTNSNHVTFGTSTSRVPKSGNLIITSEAGVPETYTINVARRAYDNDATYTMVVEDLNHNDITSIFVDDGNTPGIIQNASASAVETSITQVRVKITPTKSSTKVMVGSTDYTGQFFPVNITHTGTPGIHGTQAFQIVPETGTRSITFQVYGKQLDNTKYLSRVIITGAGDATQNTQFGYLDGQTPTALTQAQFDFTIAQATNGEYYKLDLTALSSKAKIYATQATASNINQTQYLYTGVAQFEINKLTYVYVEAEDPSYSQSYVVNVTFTDTRDTNANISSISVIKIDYKGNETDVSTFEFNKNVTNQPKINIGYEITALKFTVTYESDKASLVVADGLATLNESTRDIIGTTYNFQFQAQAENTTHTSMLYIIPVERAAGNTDNSITDLKINNVSLTDFTSTSYTYPYLYNRNVSTLNMNIIVSTGARFRVNYGGTQTYANPVQITGLTAGAYKIVTISVESEVAVVDGTGVSQDYNFYIFNASNDITIDDIRLVDADQVGSDPSQASDLSDIDGHLFSYAGATSPQAFVIKYASANPYIYVDHSSATYADIQNDGLVTLTKSTSTDTQKNVTVKITSEYGKLLTNAGFTVPNTSKSQFVFNFTRKKASSDKTLVSLAFTFDSSNSDKDRVLNASDLYTGTTLIPTLTFEHLGVSPSVTISYTKNDITSRIDGLTDPDTGTISGTSSEQFGFTSATSEVIRFKIYAEDNSYNEIKITFAKDTAVQDTNCDISTISLEGDVTNTNQITNFSNSVPSYPVTLRATNTDAKLRVVLASNKATLTIDGSTYASGALFTKQLDKTNGTTTITIRVTAENVTYYKDFTITIKTPTADTDNTLKTLRHSYGSVNEGVPGFASNTISYTVHVKHDIETYTLTPTLNSTNATLSSNNTPLTLHDGDNNAVIVVKSEAGVDKTYTIKVVRDYDISVTNIEILDNNNVNILGSFDPDTDKYPLNDIPYSVKDLTVNVTTVSGNNVTTTITGDKNLNAGVMNQIRVTVAAQSGDSKIYYFNVKREAGKTGNSIVSYTTEDNQVFGTTSISGTTISYIIDRATTVFNPTIVVSDKATWKLVGNTDLQIGAKNVKTIVVTSETGEDKSYTINVYTASTVKDIVNIQVLTDATSSINLKDKNNNVFTYDPLVKVYNFEINYKESAGYLKVTPTANSYQKIYINNVEMSNLPIQPEVGNNNEYTIVSKSEYGVLSGDTDEQVSYRIIIKRDQAKSDATLKALTLTVGGVNVQLTPAFDRNTFNYSAMNLGDTTTSVNIAAELNDTSATLVSGTGNQQLPATSYEREYAIVVKAEDGTENTYTIFVRRGQLSLDEDNTINYITLRDSNGKEYITKNTVWDSTRTQNIQIAASATSFTIYADKVSKSESDVYYLKANEVVQHSDSNTTYQSVISSDMRENTIMYRVYAKAKNGTDGDIYTINITFLKASSVNTLDSILINGKSITGFNKDTTYYYIDTYNNSTSQIDIYPLKTDEKSEIAAGSDTGTIYLQPGERKVLTITVKAEDGNTKTYTISVGRSEADPYLKSITVTSYKLMNKNGTIVDFDKDVKKYYITVPYTSGNVTFMATYDNVNYVVSCNDTTDGEQGSLMKQFITKSLEVGENEYTIGVTSTSNRTSNYTLVIKKSTEKSSSTKVNQLSMKASGGAGAQLIEPFEYNDNITSYSLSVSNTTKSLDLGITLDNNGGIDSNGDPIEPATYEVIGNTELKTGENDVFVVVTAGDGTTKKLIQVKVTREPYEFSISSKELTTLKDDYSNDKYPTSYSVSSKTTQFTVEGLNLNSTAEGEQPKITISNNGRLNVGENDVVITITAPDGTVETKTIKVVREKMAYTVDKTAYDYTCEEVKDKERYYTIDLGDKTANAITDYTKYIKFEAEKNELVVENLTDTSNEDTNEVVLKVSTKDGAESEIVHLQLQSSTFQKVVESGSIFDIIFWIILGIALIILIIILICVNRDKYGSISKKRKAA